MIEYNRRSPRGRYLTIESRPDNRCRNDLNFGGPTRPITVRHLGQPAPVANSADCVEIDAPERNVAGHGNLVASIRATMRGISRRINQSSRRLTQAKEGFRRASRHETDLEDAASRRIIEHGGWNGDDHIGARGRGANLAELQGRSEQPGAAQSAGRDVSAAGEVQRRAHLGAAARGRRAGRPDLGRRLRPDGRDRRLRPVARRQVRDLLRAAHPRGHARRAAHDGLGAAAGALQGQQAQRRPSRRSKPGWAARPPRSSWPSRWASPCPSSRR